MSTSFRFLLWSKGSLQLGQTSGLVSLDKGEEDIPAAGPAATLVASEDEEEEDISRRTALRSENGEEKQNKIVREITVIS